jgi:hypothetical protein
MRSFWQGVQLYVEAKTLLGGFAKFESILRQKFRLTCLVMVICPWRDLVVTFVTQEDSPPLGLRSMRSKRRVTNAERKVRRQALA